MKNINIKLKSNLPLTVGEFNLLSNLEKDNKNILGLVANYVKQFLIRK